MTLKGLNLVETAGQASAALEESVRDEKKRLGAFYTPDELSMPLCQWAIKSANETILEPSFGGCGFLRSAANRVTELNGNPSSSNIYGCDIDPKAFVHLGNSVGHLVDVSQFELCDFLRFTGNLEWPQKFDVVVGNPPYLPYQKIDNDSRAAAVNLLLKKNYDIDLRSSSWAYFVLLSLLHLKEGGRVAWVLPGSFAQANYATKVRRILAKSFKRVHAFNLKERMFLYEGTDEQTIVLLCDQFDAQQSFSGSKDIPLTNCEGLSDLIAKIELWEEGGLKETAFCFSAVFDHLNEIEQQVFLKLFARPDRKQLGDLLDVRIGLVTGDNSFFLVNRETALQHNMSESELEPVLTKFVTCPGIELTKSDHAEFLKTGHPALLVSSDPEFENSIEKLKYLGQYPSEKLRTVSTFKKRAKWCKISDGKVPDAFFPVMHHLGPRLVLNHERLNCTNTVHRGYFKPDVTVSKRQLLAISLLSSFSQISAEIHGRKYGSGVLKHEPREAERIAVLLPTSVSHQATRAAYTKIDRYLRLGDIVAARKHADHFILAAIDQASDEVLNTLELGLQRLRTLRHRK